MDLYMQLRSAFSKAVFGKLIAKALKTKLGFKEATRVSVRDLNIQEGSDSDSYVISLDTTLVLSKEDVTKMVANII